MIIAPTICYLQFHSPSGTVVTHLIRKSIYYELCLERFERAGSLCLICRRRVPF
jgi:hypothetical protein